jgi:hypothetical protein
VPTDLIIAEAIYADLVGRTPDQLGRD